MASQTPTSAPVNGQDFATQHHDTYPAIDPTTQSNCHGRAVLITGASKGVGRATALAFAAAGASYICIAARSDLSAVTAAIKARAAASNKPLPSVLALQMDVHDLSSIEACARKVREHVGRLDILYNNAGYLSAFETIIDADPAEWWLNWETNVRGIFYCTRAFLPLLLDTKDGLKTIVNTSSVGAFGTNAGGSGYEGTKLAVLRFTQCTVAEYGEKGILAYSVHPGGIKTDLAKGLPESILSGLQDTPELGADALVYLTQRRREWLAGRYVSLVWDMPELLSREKEIVEEDKLKVRLVV